ncbi:Variable outer membrane protein (plasmid) [Borrelia coriaceae ATCC 43381]|uniref:Variable large protein n=1 Tax=Borrelia coriaceae ATCC 43381 TaxID=1408429 RepID=W5SY56_9SPIR|nr:Variable outer membrane protein [Borrelia coriaceae ATCC 43381]
MANGGKFANTINSTAKEDVAKVIKGAAVNAISKTLNTLTIAIRKTIDEGLKTVKEAMNIRPDDTSVVIESGNTQFASTK